MVKEMIALKEKIYDSMVKRPASDTRIPDLGWEGISTVRPIFDEMTNPYKSKKHGTNSGNYLRSLPGFADYDTMMRIFDNEGLIEKYDPRVKVLPSEKIPGNKVNGNNNIGYRNPSGARIYIASDDNGIKMSPEKRFATYLHELFDDHDTAQIHARQLAEELTRLDYRYKSVLDEVVSEGRRVGLEV
jgi:hypothetical protein